jgi:hypothetical protein
MPGLPFGLARVSVTFVVSSLESLTVSALVEILVAVSFLIAPIVSLVPVVLVWTRGLALAPVTFADRDSVNVTTFEGRTVVVSILLRRISAGSSLYADLQKVVRSSGFEPPRYCYRQPLKLVRLPVPPRPHRRINREQMKPRDYDNREPF